MTLRRALTVSLLACLVPDQQTQPTFRTTSAYVRLDVVVLDDDGRPVLDLKAGDFEVTEGGERQVIDRLELVRIPTDPLPIEPRGARDVDREIAANAAPAPDARAFVLLIDEFSLKPEDLKATRTVTERLIQSMRPADVAALIYMSRSDLGQDFTGNRHRLLEAGNQVGAALGAPSDPNSMMFTLRNAIRTLGQLPQPRRVIAFIGRGRPTMVGGYVWRELFELSEQNGVPIYALDPSGLVGPELGLEGRLEDQTPEARRALDRARLRQQDFLKVIALNTGGRSFVNRWDLAKSVDELLSDNGNYYVIGYYSTRYAADGRFHRVRVKVNRDDVEVRARPGYVSEVPAAASDRMDRSLERGAPGGDLRLRAAAFPLARSEHEARVGLAVDVLPDEPIAALQGDDLMTVVWIALDPDARIRASGSHSFEAAATGAASDATLAVWHQVSLPRERLVVRVAVSSRLRQRSGVVHIPLDLRPRELAVVVAPLVLGVVPDGRSALSSPGAANLPFHPSLARTFSRKDTLSIFSRTFVMSTAQAQAALVLQRPDGTTESLPVRVSTTSPGILDMRSERDLTGLMPGAYSLELSVGNGADATVSRATFEVR